MQAIKNTGLLNVCNNCGTAGFTPAVSYVYDPVAKTIVFTDASTIPGTDTFKIINIHVTDADGKVQTYTITAAAGTVTANTATMNPLQGYSITATVVTTGRLLGDLSIYQVGSTSPASGNLGYKNVSQASNNS